MSPLILTTPLRAGSCPDQLFGQAATPTRGLLLLDSRPHSRQKTWRKRQISRPVLQLACTYPRGCTGRRGRRLTGIKQEEKWISSLFPAKIKLVINVCWIVNERVGKRATSTDRLFLIAQRKDNQSQTVAPSLPATSSRISARARWQRKPDPPHAPSPAGQQSDLAAAWHVQKKENHASESESNLPVFWRDMKWLRQSPVVSFLFTLSLLSLFT